MLRKSLFAAMACSILMSGCTLGAQPRQSSAGTSTPASSSGLTETGTTPLPSPDSQNPLTGVVQDGTPLHIGLPKSDCANVRELPDKNAHVVTCLPGGTNLSASQYTGTLPAGMKQSSAVMAEDGKEVWVHARTSAGLEGWVATRACNVTIIPKPGDLSRVGLTARAAVFSMRDFLGAASGASDPCAGGKGPCGLDTDLARAVNGQVEQCNKMGVASMTNDPGYDPVQDAFWVIPLASACTAIKDAVVKLGQPADTPAWRESAKAVWEALPVGP